MFCSRLNSILLQFTLLTLILIFICGNVIRMKRNSDGVFYNLVGAFVIFKPKYRLMPSAGNKPGFPKLFWFATHLVINGDILRHPSYINRSKDQGTVATGDTPGTNSRYPDWESLVEA
jgi:hypothetical protein